MKAYTCIFVCLLAKATHIEAVSDLSTEAFIACSRPSLIMSDHGSNFIGATRETKELTDFLNQQKTQEAISEFCISQLVQWQFIPENTPFGGLYEAAVCSMKIHLCRILWPVKLNFEELSTVLSQVEACMNSRPLVALPPDDDGVEALTPGHFLIASKLIPICPLLTLLSLFCVVFNSVN